MPLTETQIRNLKPASTPKKHFDGEGLFLYVTPAGSKLWRMAYRFEGRESSSASANIPPFPCGKPVSQPADSANAYAPATPSESE